MSRYFDQFVALPRSFFERDTVIVAKELLGQRLVRVIDKTTILVGIISEVEAYLGKVDEASHSYRNISPRTKILYEKAGLAYTHTIHQQVCLDITTEDKGTPTSILIRSIIPESGIEFMRKKRLKNEQFDERKLTDGPGKLTKALNIDMSFYGADLTSKNSTLFVTENNIKNKKIEVSGRIGISKGIDLPLRFVLANYDSNKW